VSDGTYRVAKLAPHFDVDAFDCAEPPYNEWLTQHALAAVSSGSAAVYVLLASEGTGGGERVAGYYAICPTLVVRDEVPKRLQRGLLRAAPGWLLAKLAVDVSLRGDRKDRWGSQLLRDALERIVAGADAGGGQIIVVDADNAGLVDWYNQHGFRSTGAANLRLYMKVATARQYLAR
jgi:ribosomal protein S18 acetylase RimI-like enzyme